MASSMPLICSQTLLRLKPLCMTWIRRWSSSLIIRLKLLALIEGRGAAALAFGQFAADEVPLDEQLPIDAFELVDGDVEQIVRNLGADYAIVQHTFDLHAVLRRRPADERKLGQVPRQADAAADHDISLGAVAAKPFATVLR